MLFRCRLYRVVPGQTEAFNRFFAERLLPIQHRYGTTLVGRWQTEDGNRILALWAYKSLQAYEAIQAQVRADPDTLRAQQYRDETLGRLHEGCDEFFLTSTVPLDITALAHLTTQASHAHSNIDTANGFTENSRRFLVAERLLLRPFEASDFEAVCAYRCDPDVMRYITGEQETGGEVRAFLSRTQEYAQQVPQTQFRFAIVLRTENRVLGGCGLDITSAETREGEIGYHLLPSCWGRGYATETAHALLRFGFDDLSLHRITANCLAQNTASERVMQKAGMQQEALLRQNRRSADGWENTLIYAILEHDWHDAASTSTEVGA